MTTNDICGLVKLCLGTTYFRYGGVFYEQLQGMAIGSLLSSVVAIFEQLTIFPTPIRPKAWKYYVDDTTC